MESKLVELVNKILLKDSKEYLWHHDESLNRHFRMGPKEGPFIESSWEEVDGTWSARMVIRQDEHTQYLHTMKGGSELSEIVYYLERDAAALTKDPDYLNRVADEKEKKRMIANVKRKINAFFKTL